MRMLDYGLYQIFSNFGVAGASYDVTENDEQFILSIGVPGLTRSDVDITVQNSKRMIIKSIKSNRFSPEFSYVFTIPCEVDKEKTYANVKNGILTVYIQKKEGSEYKISLEHR